MFLIRKHSLILVIEWLLLAAIVGLATLGTYRKINTAIQQRFPLTYDLACYYVTAHTLNAGLSPYDSNAMDQTAAKLGIAMYGEYVYPPFWGTLFRPVALLSLNQLKLFWFVLNLSCLAVSLIMLGLVFGFSKTHLAFVGIATLFFPPVYETILGGNVNIILLFLLSVTLFFSLSNQKHHQTLASLCLGIAIGIKVYPIVFLFLYLVYRKFTLFFGVIIVTCMTFLLGIVARGGIDTTFYWLNNVVFSIPSKLISYVDVSLFAVVDRFFTQRMYPTFNGNTPVDVLLSSIIQSPFIGKVVAYFFALIIIGIGLFRIKRISIPATNQSFLTSFNIVVALILLVTPRVWDHYYVLLIMPLMFMIQLVHTQRMWRIGLEIVIVCVLLQRFTSKFIMVFPSPLVTYFSFIGGLITLGLLLSTGFKHLVNLHYSSAESSQSEQTKSDATIVLGIVE